MSDRKDQELERQLSELLTEGELEQRNEQEEGRRQISPKYEVRIQTELDPIVEETLKYRSMAKELDGRYDKYMEQSGKSSENKDSE